MKKQHVEKTIVLTGGGTGGHVTPLKAIAVELKKRKILKSYRLVYIGQKNDKFVEILDDCPAIAKKVLVRAGKLRRYHGRGIKQLFYYKTVGRNIRDMFLVAVGIVQSYAWLRRNNVRAVFIKGGYVGVPIGLAAAARKIPIITHDSDIRPGLANRIVAKWVVAHLVAQDASYYKYPREETKKVGIPISDDFRLAKKQNRRKLAKAIGLTSKKPIVLIVGGSLGAHRINEVISKTLGSLLKSFQIVHVAGEGDHQPSTQLGYVSLAFTGDMAEMMHLSDLVVTRAGATTLVEICSMQKPMLIIPNKLLTGGHQPLNAEIYLKEGAAEVIDEDRLQKNPQLLYGQLVKLANNKPKQLAMKQAQRRMISGNPTKKIADVISGVATDKMFTKRYFR